VPCLADLVARHRQVVRIICGHIHRAILGSLRGCGVFICPSTWMALRLDFVRDDRIELVHEPSAFAVHAQLDDALVSHVLPVGGYVPA
jgi:3',5'-cyclic-AMP phosphodiesterase